MGELHQYGIEEEESDIRAHVSLLGRRITVYKTADMVSLVRTKEYRVGNAGQPGVDGITGRGWLVPICDIEPQVVLESASFPWGNYDHSAMDLAQRGEMAVSVVKASIVANRFPLWVCGHVNDDRELDIQGTDIIVAARRHIQVKYDWLACDPEDGGSGNLFVQTHERNPLKIYATESIASQT